MNPFATDETRAKDIVGAGETIKWVGRPCGGILLVPSDAAAIPFSIMWCAFAMFWEISVARTGWSFGIIWGIPFVAVGLYMVAGRFFWDAYVRAHTLYVVTDRTAYIVEDRWQGGITSLDATALSPTFLRRNQDGSGTIEFQRTSWSVFSRGFTLYAFPPSYYALQGVPDVAHVYELVEAVRL